MRWGSSPRESDLQECYSCRHIHSNCEGAHMKKLLIIITIFVALAGLFLVSPILGKEGKKEPIHYGSAYAWGGGGNF